MSVQQQRQQQQQLKWLLNLAIAGVVGGAAAQQARAVSVTVDPLNFEPQHRSDTGVYLESRAQVTASGMRNGFQSSFGNRNGTGTFPNAGIESVYYFKLPSLAAGETVASASLWFGQVHESASSGVQPKGWNVDFYAMGFEKSETPHNAPIDMGSTGIQSNYAQSLFYVGPDQVGATWTPASGPASPVVKIQDNLLTPDLWIPFTAGAAANSQRQISAQAELDLGAYIQSNLYNNAGFTADHDLLTLRMNPDVNTYTGTTSEINQRYQVAALQTSTATYPGLVTPTLNVVVQSQWNQDNSTSSWSAAGSWSGNVPNATDRAANFGSVITAAQTVSVDAPQTVAMLKFDNSNSYTLSGSQITLEGVTPPAPPTAPDPAQAWYQVIQSTANVVVAQGSHTISAPLALNSRTNFNVVNAPSTLTVASLNANGKAVTKSGAGVVSVGTGFSSSAVNVTGGTLTIASDGTANHVVNAPAVAIATSAKLDLKDNKLITNVAPGTTTAGIYGGLQGQVQRAYDFGAWDGNGLSTSMPDAAAGLTTIGVATGNQVRGLGATDTDTFAGQTINGASTIAMYTYAGDANLDGTIDGGDYGIIDNFVQVPGADGYANGDFNYDGVIDGGDYGIIDNNIQAQGAPFPTSAGLSAAVTAVPEPAAMTLLLVPALLAARRRRR